MIAIYAGAVQVHKPYAAFLLSNQYDRNLQKEALVLTKT